jgi:hypothetical protein
MVQWLTGNGSRSKERQVFRACLPLPTQHFFLARWSGVVAIQTHLVAEFRQEASTEQSLAD